jgi:hypothetical protein
VDPISLLVGGVLVLVGYVVGHVVRPHVLESSIDSYVCQCGDALSYHDPDNGECYYAEYDYTARQDAECPCQHYVGPRPPTEVDPDEVLRQLRGDA